MKKMLSITTMLVVLAGAACRAHDIRDASDNALTNRWLYSSGDGIGKIEKFEPSLTLNAGQISGWTGCNHLQADFSVSGKSINIRQKLKTSLPCPSQAAVAGEQAFENLLQSVARYEADAGVLRLITAEGKQLVMDAYVPAPRASLTGTQWKILSAAMLPGSVGTSAMIQASTAVFDGRTLRLKHACYAIEANYAADESAMRFTNISVAELPCKEKREAEFTLQYLRPLIDATSRYTITERRLSLYSGKNFQLDFDAK